MNKNIKECMAFKNENLHIGIFLLLSVVLAFRFILYAGSTFQMDNISVNTEKVTPLNKGWSSLNGSSFIEIPSLPCELPVKSQEIVLQKELPDNLPANTYLCLETNHQSLQAYMDELLIHQQGRNNYTRFGKMFGKMWNLISLPAGSAGRIITLKLTSPYSVREMNISDIIIGSKSAILFSLVKNSLDSLIFCCFTFILGGLFIFLSFILMLKNSDFSCGGFLYLGIFSIFSSVWIITDTSLLQFVSGNQAVGYLLSFFSFLLLPVPFLLFLKTILTVGKKHLDALCLLFIINFFITLSLYVFNIKDLIETLISSHVLIAISAISVFCLCLSEWKKYRNKSVPAIFFGLCILCGSVLFNIVWFYIGYHRDTSMIYRYGLLLFIILLSAGTLRKSISLLNANTEARTYKRLAYIDTMTMLENRTAFDIEMHNLKKTMFHYHSISLILFDLNHLKTINDTYGHIAGDELIAGFGRCIHNTLELSERGFRIGGDEFAIILKNCTEKEINLLIENIKEMVKKYNTDSKYKVNFAWGYSSETISKGTAINLDNLFNDADANMYARKALMHRGRA